MWLTVQGVPGARGPSSARGARRRGRGLDVGADAGRVRARDQGRIALARRCPRAHDRRIDERDVPVGIGRGAVGRRPGAGRRHRDRGRGRGAGRARGRRRQPTTGRRSTTVEARAHAVLERVRLVATLSSLDHLVRSGRVPGIAGWAGRRLGINPLFEFRGGAVPSPAPGAEPRGRARPHRRSWSGATPRPTVGADCTSPRCTRSRATWPRLCSPGSSPRIAPATAFVGEFGPVMVVHTGPGLAGLAWWWEPQS